MKGGEARRLAASCGASRAAAGKSSACRGRRDFSGVEMPSAGMVVSWQECRGALRRRRGEKKVRHARHGAEKGGWRQVRCGV